MPSRIAEPSASETTATQELPFVTFPPFPKPPSGVTLIPFKDFRARGIQLFGEVVGGPNEEDMELDGLGIPTVELRVKHLTDECKSNTRKRKRKKKTAAAEGVPARKVPWYEEWEEGEDLRITKGKFDSNMSHVDRLFHAANDFRVNRTWPPIASGVSQLWDQFRLYVGLLVNPNVYRKPSKDGEADDDDDDDEDGLSNIQINAEDTPGSVPSSKDPARSAYSVELDDHDDDEGTLQARKSDLEEQREEKLIVFLNDPEKSVTIFLSSHMREQGLIWSERNLVNAPHLISFFLNFVLRNRVLPKASHERGIRRALDIVELGKKELPLTYKIGQALPDVFSDGCKECFGRKGGIEWSFDDHQKADDPPAPVDATITVIDQHGAETEIVLPDTEETALKDAIEDNVDMEIQVTNMRTTVPVANANTAAPITTAPPDIWSADTTDTVAGGWGATGDTEGWGSVGSDTWGAIGDGGTWGPADDNDEWGADSAPLSFAPEVTEPSWLSPPPSLTSLLGPTSFPLTHTTGIVESSTRRIKAIHLPPKDKAKIKANAAGMVEDELERRFARVVMSPWGREESDIPKPSIRKTSRGVVVMPDGEVEGDGSGKPHNPYEDDIVLVVEPAVLDTLSLGMGLGGLWVQIVREEVEADNEAPKKSNAKRGNKGKGPLDELSGNYWYLEELMGIFPSYFMSRENAK
ncbi:hypothetical protein DFJ58DRAFT_801710 [Suillus subalutaceus]|uniref:uncharacterized protein n=1 Tax=Suillus subalutaceus TaxID=48586 RepID=UPI001B86B3EE|nr:uncharacterized protein DFJ58DRAFT_801710 [Suillus subalutaceus]KAG1844950.1 hypothetical protein DFJ58DRAFT_801710 [Suillus subalutaceus]